MVHLPLRSIAQGDDKLQTHDQDTSIAQHDKDIVAHIVPKRIKLLVSERAGDEVESEIEVGQAKVGKQKVEELIHKLNVQQDLPGDSVVRPPDLLGVENGVHSREERTVEPTTSL